MEVTAYDEIPYEAGAVAATAPMSMAFVARAHGGAAPPLGEGVSVLELGCGAGENLLPLAHYHPEWSLLGIDLSSRAIERARDAASELRLSNVRFEHADVTEWVSERRYDYVIAHGLYSWVPRDARAAIRRLVSEVLTDEGLAFVSFNSQPGWGVRGRVRDTLIAAKKPTLDASRALAGALEELLAEPENYWEQLMLHELGKVRLASDSYLTHEYLAESNDAFWLSEVIGDFRDAGLAYAADALFDRVEGWVPPSRRSVVERMSDDPVRQAELLDLIQYRQLRGALFSKRTPGPRRDVALIDECFIAAAIARRSDPFDLARGVEEAFDGPPGTEVRADRPLAKMALLVLADRYPEGLRFDDLLARCRARLHDLSIPEADDDVPALRTSLAALFDHLALELRVHAPTLRTLASDRPIVSALTRWEAARSNVLTTALHSGVPLEPIDRAIVARLDGTRDREQIARSIATAIEEGILTLEGAPIGLERTTRFALDRVDALLTLLGWWGLVG